MRTLTVLAALAVLTACSSDGNDNPIVDLPMEPSPPTEPPPVEPPPPAPGPSFEVTVTNLTVGQPLSPVGLFAHDSTQQVFTVGAAASMPLERMAEGGDISGLIDAVDSFAETAGDAPIGPGASSTFTLALDTPPATDLELSVMTMLVNTNDAFTGLNGVSIADLEPGESRMFSTVAYDAGTENNTEAAGSLPGPADGGEGFNAVRDDLRDAVTMHPGVVTADDGLTGSVLDQSHRFDNPVARVRVTRTR
jgi:hypothetical protein